MPKKDFIIKILGVIGFIFIIIATFNFIVKIPNLDNQISEIEENIDEMDRERIVLDLYTATTILGEQNANLGILTNPFNQAINDYIQEDARKLMINKIFTHDIIKKGYADMDYLNKLQEMNQTELLKAEEKMSNSPYLMVENKKLNELRREKNNTQYWSAIFQIIGLSIAQLVIILEKKKRGRPKGSGKNSPKVKKIL